MDLSVVDSRNVAQVRHSQGFLLPFHHLLGGAALGQVYIQISQPLNPGMIHVSPPPPSGISLICVMCDSS